MRPIPAPRLGDTHGLLRAINQRDRVRLDEFITEFSVEDLFPPGLENALGRTRQFVSFARSAGLLNEDRGVVELTEVGKRYVRSGDEDAVFDVSSGQAEWLRRQLFERHMTDSIYHGAAIGLSLFASNPPDFHVSRLDFGRALAHLGRAGWDNENTLESQGERYTTFLRDLELLDDQSRLTEIGTQTKSELTLPVHMSMRDLAGQLNPGGIEAAEAEGEAEWAAQSAAPEPEPEPEEPAAAEPEPEAGGGSGRAGRPAGDRHRGVRGRRRRGRPGRRRGAHRPPHPALRHLGDRRARRGHPRVLRHQPRAGRRGRGRGVGPAGGRGGRAEEPGGGGGVRRPARDDLRRPARGGRHLRRSPRPGGAGRGRGPRRRVGRPRGRRRRAARAEKPEVAPAGEADAEPADDAPLPVVGLPAELAEEPVDDAAEEPFDEEEGCGRRGRPRRDGFREAGRRGRGRGGRRRPRRGVGARRRSLRGASRAPARPAPQGPL